MLRLISDKMKAMNILIQDEQRTLNALNAEIQGLYHEACVKLGLSDSACYILYVIAERGEGCTPGDISRSFGLTRQTVHSSVNTLMSKQIIEKNKGNGRVRQLYLTEKGRTVMKERILPLIALENNVFNTWTEAEKQTLLSLMRKYCDDFRSGVAKMDAVDCSI